MICNHYLIIQFYYILVLFDDNMKNMLKIVLYNKSGVLNEVLKIYRLLLLLLLLQLYEK